MLTWQAVSVCLYVREREKEGLDLAAQHFLSWAMMAVEKGNLIYSSLLKGRKSLCSSSSPWIFSK